MRLFLPPKKTSFFESYIAPLLFIGAIIVLDSLAPSYVLLTPMLSICVLAVMAFRLRTRLHGFWVVIFTINVIIALAYHANATGAISEASVVVRSVSFAVSGFLAIGLNRLRCQMQQDKHSLLEILEKLPAAAVVSDTNGTILFANKNVLKYLGQSWDETVGLSFFTFFTQPETRGEAIEEYLKLGDGDDSSEKNVLLMAVRKNRQLLESTQIPVVLGGVKCIVTVINLGQTAGIQSEPRLRVVG